MMAIFVTLHSFSSGIFYSSFCSLGGLLKCVTVFGRIRLSKDKVISHMNVILHRLYKI